MTFKNRLAGRHTFEVVVDFIHNPARRLFEFKSTLLSRFAADPQRDLGQSFTVSTRIRTPGWVKEMSIATAAPVTHFPWPPSSAVLRTGQLESHQPSDLNLGASFGQMIST